MSDITTSRRLVGAVSKDRDPNDYYPTHPVAVQDLFQYEKFEGRTLEPACGEGYMSEELKRQGLEVVSADLIERCYADQRHTGDFLDRANHPENWWDEPGFDNVITNPPFDKKILIPFIKMAIDMARKKVAMFVRLNFLEGKDRKKYLFDDPKYKPARIYVFSYRVPFERGKIAEIPEGKDPRESGGGTMAFCWCVWDKDHVGPTQTFWL